ncbi:hypothetical protein INR49_027006 [Caranx melampygus]|nr:hypothetical protein INR49_027006 [Caranx melampygus]
MRSEAASGADACDTAWLSTIVGADQILVVHNGQIAERGRHEELLVQGGLYAAMWMKQQKTLNTPTETQTNNQTQET